MSPVFPIADQVFALQLHVDGQLVQTHRLTRHQAECARVAARHLAKYLTEAYELDTPVPDTSRNESASPPPGGTSGGGEFPWPDALEHFESVKAEYEEIEGRPGANTSLALLAVFAPLESRYLNGERTKELYESMANVE